MTRIRLTILLAAALLSLPALAPADCGCTSQPIGCMKQQDSGCKQADGCKNDCGCKKKHCKKDKDDCGCTYLSQSSPCGLDFDLLPKFADFSDSYADGQCCPREPWTLCCEREHFTLLCHQDGKCKDKSKKCDTCGQDKCSKCDRCADDRGCAKCRALAGLRNRGE